MEEEIVDGEPESKQQKLQEQPTSSSNERLPPVFTKKVSSSESWNKSVGGLRKKGPLVGLVKVKKPQNNSGASTVVEAEIKTDAVASSHQNAAENKPALNGLSLLGAYSDSDNSD